MQRRITTYGLLTVACAALTTACGEADNSRRLMLGQGGSSTGNGNGGTSGNTTGMGGTSQTGMGGGGNAADAVCTGGCVEMSVPFAENPASRQAQFLFRPGGTTVVDMTNTVITWKLRAGTSDIPPDQMYVAVFAQNGMPDYAGCYGPQIALTAANGFTDNMVWVDVLTNIRDAGEPPPAAPPLPDAGAPDGGGGGNEPADTGAPPVDPGGPITERPPTCGATFDKAAVFQWGLYVGVTAAFSGTGSVRLGLDSVTYEGSDQMNVDFTDGVQLFQADAYMQPPGTTLTPR